jgi:hypothetical protein
MKMTEVVSSKTVRTVMRRVVLRTTCCFIHGITGAIAERPQERTRRM